MFTAKRLALLLIALTFTACSTSNLTTAPPSNQPLDNWEWIATPQGYDASEFDTLTVATWNVEHFVDDYDNPYIDNDRENNPDENLAERRKLLAEALIDIDADIVVFQEIESASYVQSIANEYFDDMGYRYFTSRESNDWYMNVVVMSRVPLGILHSYANADTFILGEEEEDGTPSSQNFTNNRMLSVNVHVNPSYNFMLSGLHLKAGRGERNEGWRTGQINLLREHYSMITSTDSDARILVTGDLNTMPGDQEFLQLLGSDTNLTFIDPLAGVESYTHTADDPQRQLDHILPNQAMMENLVPGSAEVATPFDAQTMRFVSDHLPVVAKFVTTAN
jgi:endonuclease/exonuclease/phosphatase family metal-dependent hydrolase